MNKIQIYLFFTIYLILPNLCYAFDWGDFHIFAVIFFSFLGGFLGLGAIFSAIYFACGKPFLNRVKDEIAETHREFHPWPHGSVSWKFQQMINSNRNTNKTQFLADENNSQSNSHSFNHSKQFNYPQKNDEKFYQRNYINDINETDCEPIIKTNEISEYYHHPQTSYHSLNIQSQTIDRPNYFEETENCRITKDESFTSSKCGQNIQQTILFNEPTKTSTPISFDKNIENINKKIVESSQKMGRKSPQIYISNTYI